MSATLYPSGPAGYDAKKLLPSGDFKKQVGKVITAIVFFFIVYLVLMLAAGALAVACFYIGISIIIAAPKFLTLMLGLGLMAVGGSVFFFLIKCSDSTRTFVDKPVAFFLSTMQPTPGSR